MKIDEQKLDLYIGSIIEATASSLGDIVALNSQRKILIMVVHHL